MRCHTRLVYGSYYRFTGRADDARDLTQDVFIRVFRSLHTYDPGSGAFRTWLIRVTRNLLIDHYRKTKKDQALDPIEANGSRLKLFGLSGGVQLDFRGTRQIPLREVAGQARITSERGKIILEPVDSSDFEVKLARGNVDVKLSPDSPHQLEATVERGNIVHELTERPEKSKGQVQLKGPGAGGPRVRLTVGRGDVTVKR